MPQGVVERKRPENYLESDIYYNEVARGNVVGAWPLTSYGKLVTVGAVTNALVETQANTALRVPAVAGEQMSIVSTSVQDGPAGTGCRQVVIEYLDGDLNEAVEIVTLNGLTPVLTQATDIRWVQAMHGTVFGSTLYAVGQVRISSGGYVYAEIGGVERTSKTSFRRVPAGKTLMIADFYAGISSGTAAAKALVQLVSTQINGIDQSETGVFYGHLGIDLQDTSSTIPLAVPFPVPSGHIVGMTCTVDKAATITAGFIGWIE